jgi:hypothetical protein
MKQMRQIYSAIRLYFASFESFAIRNLGLKESKRQINPHLDIFSVVAFAYAQAKHL